MMIKKNETAFQICSMVKNVDVLLLCPDPGCTFNKFVLVTLALKQIDQTTVPASPLLADSVRTFVGRVWPHT